MNFFKFLKKIAEFFVKVIAFIFKYFLVIFIVITILFGFFIFRSTNLFEKWINNPNIAKFQNITIDTFDHRNVNPEESACNEKTNEENAKEIKRISKLFISFSKKAQNGGNASYEITELCDFWKCDTSKISTITEFSGINKMSQDLNTLAFLMKKETGMLKKNILKQHIQIIKKSDADGIFSIQTAPSNLILASNLISELNYVKTLEILEKIEKTEGLDVKILEKISQIKNELTIINHIQSVTLDDKI